MSERQRLQACPRAGLRGVCLLIAVVVVALAGSSISVHAASGEDPAVNGAGDGSHLVDSPGAESPSTNDVPPPPLSQQPAPDVQPQAIAPAVPIAPVAPVAPAPKNPEAVPTIVSAGLPPYKFGYTNGLYATIAGYTALKDFDVRNQRQMRLNVDGFHRAVPIRVVIQNHVAPLVVVLMGIDGKADGKLGKLWPAWLGQNGYHVLTFDSTFLPGFVSYSGHGVTGNVVVESERVVQIINAFLKSGEMRNNVSQIGIAGMSYGGLQALMIGTMAKDNRLPFHVDAIQAYSPPVRLAHTGQLIDQWYAEDRWNYTLVDLAGELQGHKPVPPGSPVPFSDSVMRAGLSAIFRIGLSEVVLKNDKEYNLNLLPNGNEFDDAYVKQDYAETWGYGRFMTQMSYPYWQKRQNLKDLGEMLGPIDLCNLVVKQPANSETILSVDDPFNTPDDLNDLKSCARAANVTFLPTGGHLGFVSDPWIKAKLLSMFRAAPVETPGPATTNPVAPAVTPAPEPIAPAPAPVPGNAR